MEFSFPKVKVILWSDREHKCDLIVLFDDFSYTLHSVKAILRDGLAAKWKPIWGIDEKGELNSA